MAVFVLSSAPSDTLIERWAKAFAAMGENLLPFIPSRHLSWQSREGAQKIHIHLWENNTENAQASHAFTFETGWRVPGYSEDFGEFFNMKIDPEGNGSIKRSATTLTPLYRAMTPDGVTLISNRASLCALGANGGNTHFALSEDFMAVTLAVGWPLFPPTLFEGVTALRFGEEPTFKNGTVSFGTPPDDYWWSDELHEAYARDKDKFWDDRLTELLRATDMFFDENGNSLLKRYSLSGGKDSRLLFAALKTRSSFQEVPIITHGSPYHHDVVTASKITRHFGFKHEISDTVFNELNLGEVLPEHLFLSEGRTPPLDATRWHPKRTGGLYLYGHEIGLREPFGNRDEDSCPAWTETITHFFRNFDTANILKNESISVLNDIFIKQINYTHERTKNLKNLGWRFYVENRLLHYVANIYNNGNSIGLTPYPLLNHRTSRICYVIGKQARIEERYHFELMRRLDAWLTFECPFGNRRWPLSLRESYSEGDFFAHYPIPVYHTASAPMKGSHAAFNRNRLLFIDYIMDRMDFIEHIIDKEKIEKAYKNENWNASFLNAISYLLMYCGAKSIDWSTLSPIHREKRSNPYPPIVIRNGDSPDQNKAEAMLASYRQAIPEAVYEIARTRQIDIFMNDARRINKQGRHAEALALYAAAAVLGDPQAQLSLGKCYFEGMVVTKDIATALNYITIAAQRGLAHASHFLGQIYESGKEVEADLEKAKTFYRKAAESGHGWSWAALAALLDKEKQNSEELWAKARDYFLDSNLAETNSHAALHMGEILYHGKAGSKDEMEGIRYLKRAQELGNKRALTVMRALGLAPPAPKHKRGKKKKSWAKQLHDFLKRINKRAG